MPAVTYCYTHDIYIDGKENTKTTNDHMKMLMLTLPFIVCDFLAPKVHVPHDVLNCDHLSTCMYAPSFTHQHRAIHNTEAARVRAA